MRSHSNLIEQHSLLIFLALTPLISLAMPLFLPLPAAVIPLLMVFVPAFLAITLAALSGGRKEVGELWRRLFRRRIGFRWYATAVLLALGLRLSMSVLALLLGWIPAIQINAWSLPEFVLIGTFIVIGAVSEELGWRGYVLPKLLPYRSGLFSALVTGVLWGAIHLGLTLPGQMNAGTHWLPTIVYISALSVILTWFFIQTRGSLVVPILFHAGQSIFVFLNGAISPDQQLVLLAAAAAVVALVLVLLFWVKLQHGSIRGPAVLDAG